MFIRMIRIAASLLMVTGLAVLVSAPATAEEPPPAVNLLPNPSFEQRRGDDVDGWKSHAWAGEATGRWTVEKPGRASGQCVSIASEKGLDAAWTTTVAVKPNTHYRLSGWIKTENVRGAAGALLNLKDNPIRTIALTGTTDWTRVSTTFHSGNVVEVKINCLFGGWGSSTGRAWYDDLTLESIIDPIKDTTAVVRIDPSVPSIPYDPMIFGGFLEHFDDQIYGGVFDPGSPLSDDKGFRKDVIAAMKELKLSVVRWPGGCFASGYHWKDGVGPKRKPVPDPVWGVTDPNTFGTDEFVEWCRRVGCDPYICTNAGNGTPEEMREWVEYCNGTKGPFSEMRKANGHADPLKVRYWSIGNENWGQHEIGASTPAKWGPLVKESAKLMRGADAKLTLLAAATPDRKWTLPLLKHAGDDLEYVAVHGYWLRNHDVNAIPDYMGCIIHSEAPEQTIREVVNVLDEAGYRDRIKIAFDEWNLRGWHHPGFPRKTVGDPKNAETNALIRARDKNNIASQYNMADALFSASFLNGCLRHAKHVGMTNIAPSVNTRGPLYVHPKGIVKRTTFHTLAMYANLLQSRVGTFTVDSGQLAMGKKSVATLDVLVTVDESAKTWAIALANRHPSAKLSCNLNVGDVKPNGSYDAVILTGDSPDAYNDIEHPDRVKPTQTKLTFKEGSVELPPHSLIIVTIPLPKDHGE